MKQRSCDCPIKPLPFPYLGTQKTPKGAMRLFDTGHRASPLEMAELAGFQTAMMGAKGKKGQQKVWAKLRDWTQAFHARHLGDAGKSQNIMQTDLGWIVVDRPYINKPKGVSR